MIITLGKNNYVQYDRYDITRRAALHHKHLLRLFVLVHLLRFGADYLAVIVESHLLQRLQPLTILIKWWRLRWRGCFNSLCRRRRIRWVTPSAGCARWGEDLRCGRKDATGNSAQTATGPPAGSSAPGRSGSSGYGSRGFPCNTECELLRTNITVLLNVQLETIGETCRLKIYYYY